VTLQLRYLQTLTEIATEKNSTILFPFPIDIVRPFLGMMGTSEELAQAAARSNDGHAKLESQGEPPQLPAGEPASLQPDIAAPATVARTYPTPSAPK
jgi:hypothetical protein